MLKPTNGRANRDSISEGLTTARRRRKPQFIIVNASGQTIMASCDPSSDLNNAMVTAQIIAELKSGEDEVLVLISPTKIVRAFSLFKSIEPSYALFLESIESRNLLADAGVSFGLTLREIDVLRLILHGMGTSEIANKLSIAVTTVHAHVKNIARKTKSTKRTEILAKLLGVR